MAVHRKYIVHPVCILKVLVNIFLEMTHLNLGEHPFFGLLFTDCSQALQVRLFMVRLNDDRMILDVDISHLVVLYRVLHYLRVHEVHGNEHSQMPHIMHLDEFDAVQWVQ